MFQREDIRSPIPQLAASRSSEEDDEWHSRDPAETTPQLLRGIWRQIAQGGSMVKGVSFKQLGFCL